MKKFNIDLNQPIRVHVDIKKEEKRRLNKIIKCFFNAKKGKIKANKCIRLIMKHLRYFIEIDKHVNKYSLYKKIPTSIGPDSFYKESCEMVHNSSKRDIQKKSSERMNLNGFFKVSIIHIFKISIFLASSDYAMGKSKVEEILANNNLPLDEYGINAIEQEMLMDKINKNSWLI